jgi:hypothetical protein
MNATKKKVFPAHTPCIVHGVLVGASDFFPTNFVVFPTKGLGIFLNITKLKKTPGES